MARGRRPDDGTPPDPPMEARKAVGPPTPDEKFEEDAVYNIPDTDQHFSAMKRRDTKVVVPERLIRAKTPEMGKGTAKGRQKLTAADARENMRWYRQRTLLKYGAPPPEVGPLLPMPQKLAAKIDAIHKRVQASPQLMARKNALAKARRQP